MLMRLKRSTVQAIAVFGLLAAGLVSVAPEAVATQNLLADPNADVHAFGVPHYGDTTAISPNSPVVGMAALADGSGYWTVASDGGVFNYGAAPFLGSLGAIELTKPIVGMAAHPSGDGYWLVASDGGVFAFGAAPFLGSLGGLVLDEPIVGMAAHPSGDGYWLAASDGGVFAYGRSAFFGSMGGIALNEPVVAMAGHPSGDGYWLAASDGGIFTFGAAAFFGSTGALKLDQPVVALAAVPDASGYWLAAADGGIFSFGSAEFLGSAAGTSRNEKVVAMAAPASGAGYWLARGAGPTWPLTGLPAGDTLERPALAVKIDNSVAARGQWGLDGADIVFEELVEGGDTRLVAVFHSQDASTVGPIRSARETDLEILPMFGRSVLAYSGANQTVRDSIRDSSLIDAVYLINAFDSAFFRTSTRRAPHNLLSGTDLLRGFAPPGLGGPPSVFAYRLDVIVPPVDIDTGLLTIDFGTTTVQWQWDGQRYVRYRRGAVHLDAAFQAVTATNVVVLETMYTTSQATGSPVASLLGSGLGYVLIDGQRTAVSWSRQSLTDAFALATIDGGDDVLLAPGATWVELVPQGNAPFDGS